jgi:glycosyltransferase involved in cell wall biosynthesis
MAKFIAQMIGRNEAHRYLWSVLEHLVPQVDEIVFTDDASQDATPEIAREFGAHVYRHESPLFTVHEGRLRQAAWENLAHHARLGDWILAIDCDERLFATDPAKPLSSLLQTTQYHALEVTFFHMWNERQYRIDKGWAPSPQTRIFRYADQAPFADNALACGCGPEYVRLMELTGKVMCDTGLLMQHLGYVREEDRVAKHRLYMEIDGGRFHVHSHLESIVDAHPALLTWNP